MLADQQSQSNAVGIGQSDGMASGKLTGELMKAEARLKRVLLQSADCRSEAGFEIRVLPEEPTCLPEKLFGCDNVEHAHSPSRSSAFSSSSAEANLRTRPAFTSSSDAFTRATYASSASATNS